MTFSILPVQPATGKKRNAKGYKSSQKPPQEGFSALLEEMAAQSGAARLDGFAARPQTREASEREQELRGLQRRVYHVNGYVLSLLADAAR